MNKNQTESIMNIYNSLNVLEVNGKKNLTIVVGCMNLIEELLKEDSDGNKNPE